MLIKCPKCRSVYDLPQHLIKDAGCKMRCAECQEIWTAYPSDALKTKPKGSPDEIKKMFERVSKQTENLFGEPEVKTVEKIRVVNVTHYKHTFNLLLALIAMLCLAAVFYYMRYDVVRLIPESEKFYSKLNLESIPYGQNLEFRNIATREFSDEAVAKIQISGVIVNNSRFTTLLPPIRIDIYGKGGELLSNTIKQLPMPRLEPGYKLLFNYEVINPTPYGKSIYLTFDENLHKQHLKESDKAQLMDENQ